MAVRQTSPEEFEDRIIFVSMFNNIDRTKKRNSNECFSISLKVRDNAKRFQRDIGLCYDASSKLKVLESSQILNG